MKKILIFVGVMICTYSLVTYFALPHKWEWLSFIGILLAALLTIWKAPSKHRAFDPQKEMTNNPWV
jgi:CHASE2 domain-containing sensor protein